ncbi:uncharacterized protein SPSK_09989 [Sporothrix schenckii 1099-18]|uniref:Uncharacterized protein n=1 Tax=Sporothrix schenckii 1099-18 TaxID=1397361 RepID=A0A0F2M495_SPOSC|nr:uncharacterized protein SPSK_09989 [Sporothrix schenckii 1099-18]KJR84437.1 hypothetical protein SPSK_09989 [Sporothrix schenckii 1099-18]
MSRQFVINTLQGKRGAEGSWVGGGGGGFCLWTRFRFALRPNLSSSLLVLFAHTPPLWKDDQAKDGEEGHSGLPERETERKLSTEDDWRGGSSSTPPSNTTLAGNKIWHDIIAGQILWPGHERPSSYHRCHCSGNDMQRTAEEKVE